MSTLEIRDLHVSVEDKEILRGVDLTVKSGETHAIMGPNGSGKSTLAYAVAGHPKYTVTGGTVTLDGEDVLAMSVDERARAGVFLARTGERQQSLAERQERIQIGRFGDVAARTQPFCRRPVARGIRGRENDDGDPAQTI